MTGSPISQSGWRVSVRRYAPLVLWVGVIFFLSSPEGSFTQTSRIIGPLLHFFFPDILPETEALIHGIVRKTAHFTEYAILAFLAVRAFVGSPSLFIRQRSYVLALVIVMTVASLDEVNQSFEASRTSSIWDVMLDIFGGVAAIAVYIWFRSRQGRSIPAT
jgi:VanZ family protein